jgi:nucleotide-binding universal stress UspA family protein
VAGRLGRADNGLVFRRVLVAFDGSPGAHRALEAAVDLARSEDAELIGVAIEAHLPHYGATVGEVDEEREFEEADARRLLAEATAYAAERGVAMGAEILAGHPAQTIVQLAKDKGVDAIVIGHSGHSAVWGLFLGATAKRVSRHAHFSVLIVR